MSLRTPDTDDTTGFAGTTGGLVSGIPFPPLWHHQRMDDLIEAGFGLDHDSLSFGRTTEKWLLVGSRLRDRVASELAEMVTEVEHIGSSAVEGMIAKPIVDLAAGITTGQEFAPVRATLEKCGWIYRGDAADDGGHVFVLETQPWHRVAHLHVVEHEGRQWQKYLQLRDLLRHSPEARARYEAVKVQLSRQVGDDRDAYTKGKSAIVEQLLHFEG